MLIRDFRPKKFQFQIPKTKDIVSLLTRQQKTYKNQYETYHFNPNALICKMHFILPDESEIQSSSNFFRSDLSRKNRLTSQA